ncbi:MAG: acylphosphatase [Candidatus Binatia bacterium]
MASGGEKAIALRLLVSGRVQGVWFRASLAEKADALGLAGWVRNLPDGRVEAFVEGDPNAVSRIASWCHDGPPAARVDEVKAVREPPLGLRGFEIRAG